MLQYKLLYEQIRLRLVDKHVLFEGENNKVVVGKLMGLRLVKMGLKHRLDCYKVKTIEYIGIVGSSTGL